MATSKEYIEWICGQIHGDYAVTYKKMFGEYMVYLNEKPILLVCDNTVYVKKLPELADLLRDADCGYPYDGAKEHFVWDMENRHLADRVIAILEQVTPLPKKKHKN